MVVVHFHANAAPRVAAPLPRLSSSPQREDSPLSLPTVLNLVPLTVATPCRRLCAPYPKIWLEPSAPMTSTQASPPCQTMPNSVYETPPPKWNKRGRLPSVRHFP
ncbi:hypothetical protein GUJ93_ZPchr0001g31796 [Zizania palustris]|uniref:Uncharacterized protein n=1 Tax=Zizania palustris TaxID=103762 RepID=A0A8J5SB24_ZIZPA|nr:hypothetical protein GUJ93_ZPchr0001g31796 [Zizania palustris]